MAKKTFESALQRLEQITEELEQGDLSLEKSLKKFNEGIELVNFCTSRLEEARNQVDLLLQENEGIETTPFSDEETGGE